MPSPVTAPVATPSAPVSMSAIADMLGGSIDFAALLTAQFGDLEAADSPLAVDTGPIAGAEGDTALAAQSAPGLDLAALLNATPGVITAVSSATVGNTSVGAGDAGTDGVSLTSGLLQSIGESRASLSADLGETANLAAEHLPKDAASDPSLPAIQHAGTHREAATAGSAPRVDTPFGDARWASDFNQKIVWMARQDLQSAQISINPPNLGPIEVSLQLGPDQATATFNSPHAEVREALESALPRLREMLAGAGISLGQTQVGAQNQQQANAQQNQASGESQRIADGSILGGANEIRQSVPLRQQIGNGLVDTFA